MGQEIFDPVDYDFTWTADWYKWDSKSAHAKAKQARDERAKQLRSQGLTVKTFSLRNQLVSKGGIGTGRPHIELVCTCYGVNAS